MKKILILFMLIMLAPMISFAQKNERIITEEIKNKINPIKTNFERINSIDKWTKIKTIETDDSAEGGYVNYYYLNEKLEKVVVQKFGESGKFLAEYYVLNSTLSFVFERNITYNAPLYWGKFDHKKSKIEEKRYYFEKKQLIHFVGKSMNLNEESKGVIDDFEALIKAEKNTEN
ncbi:hypothetical protein ACTS9C_02115 [Empedobacter brevis]